MKTIASTLVICASIFISGIAFANNALYATFIPQDQAPNVSTVKINWSKPNNKNAAKYKSAFEYELSLIKTGQKQLLGQRYLVINPGCGSECQVIGIYDTRSGDANLSDVTSSYGVDYRSGSTLLIVNPQEAIEASYGTEGQPGWLKTEYYHVLPGGVLKLIRNQ